MSRKAYIKFGYYAHARAYEEWGDLTLLLDLFQMLQLSSGREGDASPIQAGLKTIDDRCEPQSGESGGNKGFV